MPLRPWQVSCELSRSLGHVESDIYWQPKGYLAMALYVLVLPRPTPNTCPTRLGCEASVRRFHPDTCTQPCGFGALSDDWLSELESPGFEKSAGKTMAKSGPLPEGRPSSSLRLRTSLPRYQRKGSPLIKCNRISPTRLRLLSPAGDENTSGNTRRWNASTTGLNVETFNTAARFDAEEFITHYQYQEDLAVLELIKAGILALHRD